MIKECSSGEDAKGVIAEAAVVGTVSRRNRWQEVNWVCERRRRSSERYTDSRTENRIDTYTSAQSESEIQGVQISP